MTITMRDAIFPGKVREVCSHTKLALLMFSGCPCISIHAPAHKYCRCWGKLWLRYVLTYVGSADGERSWVHWLITVVSAYKRSRFSNINRIQVNETIEKKEFDDNRKRHAIMNLLPCLNCQASFIYPPNQGIA